MYNLIKWGLKVTQRSIKYAKDYDMPTAIIINYIGGVCFILALLPSIILLILAATGVGSWTDAQIPIAMMIALGIVWFICLRVLEMYLDYTQKKTK